jgi:hypothetical protein
MREIDAKGAALQDQALKQRGVLDLHAVGLVGCCTQALQLLAECRQRGLPEELDDPIRDLADDLDQEVGASAGRIEHVELEQLLRGTGRVSLRQLADPVEVGLQRGPHRTLDEVSHELGLCVVDAAALAAALVGHPDQLSRLDVGLLALPRGHVSVSALVVAEIAVGDREAQRK